MLTYLPGETIGNRVPWPAWAGADSMLAQVGHWLRRLHDLTAEFVPPAGERWFIGGEMRSGLIIAAWLTERNISGRLRASVPELDKIPSDKVLKELRVVVAGSVEDEQEGAATPDGVRSPSHAA